MEGSVSFTQEGFIRGVRKTLPLLIGLSPFGFVVGLITERHGLTLVDCVLMNAFVYAGASELVALANWTHPASILAASFGVLVVNLRFMLMGPALAPWFSGLRPVWRYLGLSILVDHAWALSITDMRKGGRDAAFFIGLSIPLWVSWMVTVILGFVSASWLNLPEGSPLFFGALAAFVSLLVPLWRSRADILPWLVAAGIAAIVAHLLPHSSWYIPAGAICGCITGALLDPRRHG